MITVMHIGSEVALPALHTWNGGTFMACTPKTLRKEWWFASYENGKTIFKPTIIVTHGGDARCLQAMIVVNK